MNDRKAMRPRTGRSAAAAPLAAALLAAGCAAPDAGMASPGLDAGAAFARMKTLAGEYDATATGMEGTTRVSYEITSGGHALLERLNDGGDEEMASIYYLEGADLALVHYCSAGNRPHMRLDRAASTIDDLRFEWDGTATDIDPSKDGHIHRARFRFPREGAVETDWEFWQDGKPAHAMTFVLERAPAASAAATGATPVK